MKFSLNQQDLQKSLNYCQGVIEKRSTLPILSNVLLHASESKLTIVATDLDLIFIHQILNVEILEEGKTTTSSSIMYDIVRKFSSGKKITVEIDNLKQLKKIIGLKFNTVLFDNMNNKNLKAGVKMAKKYYGETEGRNFANSYQNMTPADVALFEIVIDRITTQEI